ncbi:hypothetical protein ACQCVH_13330 [Bacillus infantis]|uniref:hypothetical protein n=1 Tax=Bacillus infantis TaxID=324767 RepID=UPI003CF29F23
MKRKWETMIAMAGALLCLIFLGGFSMTILTMDEVTFEEAVYPVLQTDAAKPRVSESYEAVKTLAVWFGVTMIAVLVFTAIATLFIRKNKNPKAAAVFYTLAGLTALAGTQMIAFPLAFIFFLAAALCLFRKIQRKGGAFYA